MPPVTSDVWQHFEKGEGTAKCRYCHTEFIYRGESTSNLKRHMERKHISIPFKRSRVEQASDEASSNIPSNTLEEYVGIQRYFPNIRPPSAEMKRDLDETLLIMICKEYYPFSMVEDKHFQTFVKKLHPTYELPSRKTLTNALLPTINEKTMLEVKNKLNQAKAIALTVDGWSNLNQVSFVAVTAHFVNLNFEMCSFLLECSEFTTTHTAHNISIFIKNVMVKFDIEDKVTCIVTDNARNMKNAASDLGIPHFSCFAHSLNLVVQDAIKNSIKPTVEEVKRIIMHFKHSGSSAQKLEEIQKNLKSPCLKLKQDVPTRWNSTFDMLERFFKNKIPIVSCLASIKFKHNLSDVDWTTIEQSISVLQFFDLATKEIMVVQDAIKNSIKPTVEEVKRIIMHFKHSGSSAQKLEEIQKNLKSPCLKLKQDVPTRWNSTFDMLERFLKNKIPIVSCLASIKFKHNLSDIDWTTIEQAISVLQFFDLATKEIMGEKTVTISKVGILISTLNFEMSKAHEGVILNDETAASVPCERVFSKAGGIVTEKRNRLLSKKLNEILFIKYNL
uniref:BED-type domain-containing protein n=1 Tax=Anopheles epiroticus TaxID=199890 RepID=A0A182PWX0_9DIPT